MAVRGRICAGCRSTGDGAGFVATLSALASSFTSIRLRPSVIWRTAASSLAACVGILRCSRSARLRLCTKSSASNCCVRTEAAADSGERVANVLAGIGAGFFVVVDVVASSVSDAVLPKSRSTCSSRCTLGVVNASMRFASLNRTKAVSQCARICTNTVDTMHSSRKCRSYGVFTFSFSMRCSSVRAARFAHQAPSSSSTSRNSCSNAIGSSFGSG